NRKEATIRQRASGTGPFPQRWRSWPKPPARRVLRYATAKLLRDEAESMLPNIDREQVRKLAGLGLTQNDIASFVGWSQSLISLGFSSFFEYSLWRLKTTTRQRAKRAAGVDLLRDRQAAA